MTIDLVCWRQSGSCVFFGWIYVVDYCISVV